MERKASAEKTVKDVETWYNNLTEEEKKDITIFAIIGDSKEGVNHQVLIGDYPDLVLTLGHAMVGDDLFTDIVKEAVTLVDEFEKLEEIKELGFRQDEKVS